MRRRRRSFSTLDADGEINLTALLDVVFNLLFFFSLATTIRNREAAFEVRLPSSTSAPLAETRQERIPEIQVGSDGRIGLDGQAVSVAELEAALIQGLAQNPRRRAVLSADGSSTMQQVTSVMDACRRAGLTDVVQRVAKGK